MPPSGEATIAIEWALMTTSVVFVSLRIKTYFRRRKTGRLPEIILLFGLLVEISCVICDTLTYHLGGLSVENLADIPVTLPLNKLSFASDVLFFLGVFFPKSCLLAFYYHLIPITSTRLRLVLKCVIVYVVISFTTIFLLLFASCRPLSSSWALSSDYCPFPNSETLFLIHWALDFSCDVIIFVLPFFLIHSLQLRKRQKYGVYGIFLLGAITIAICVSRFITLMVSVQVTPIYIWAAAEFCGSNIVVCLPSLKPLIKSMGDSFSRSNPRSHSMGGAWPYDRYATAVTTPKQGVVTVAEAASDDGSQVELRQLEQGIMKTTDFSVD